MGIFHMFKHLKQSDEATKLSLYSMQQVIGLEIHPTYESALNYLSIGGYNKEIVDPQSIVWMNSFSQLNWEVYVSSLQF